MDNENYKIPKLGCNNSKTINQLGNFYLLTIASKPIPQN